MTQTSSLVLDVEDLDTIHDRNEPVPGDGSTDSGGDGVPTKGGSADGKLIH